MTYLLTSIISNYLIVYYSITKFINIKRVAPKNLRIVFFKKFQKVRNFRNLKNILEISKILNICCYQMKTQNPRFFG